MPVGLRGFQRGNKVRLGMKNGEKQKEATRRALIGNTFWKGRKHTEEARAKISTAQKGVPCKNRSLSKMGDKNPMWKGGTTPLRKKLYFSQPYKDWRKAVFERDNYTCVWCAASRENQGDVRVELHADHIKAWCDYPELRFNLANGRTLCKSCHRATDTYGVKRRK